MPVPFSWCCASRILPAIWMPAIKKGCLIYKHHSIFKNPVKSMVSGLEYSSLWLFGDRFGDRTRKTAENWSQELQRFVSLSGHYAWTFFFCSASFASDLQLSKMFCMVFAVSSSADFIRWLYTSLVIEQEEWPSLPETVFSSVPLVKR